MKIDLHLGSVGLSLHKLKWQFCPGDRYFYEQFIHLTRIFSRSNTQFLRTKQQAYQSFLVTPRFDSVCATVVGVGGFYGKYLHEHELQLSDYIYVQRMNVFCQYVYIFIEEKYLLPCLPVFFMVKR